jgi:hypothetical protein
VCRQFEENSGDTLDALVRDGTVRLRYRPIALLDRASTDDYSTRVLNAAAVVADESGDDASRSFPRRSLHPAARRGQRWAQRCASHRPGRRGRSERASGAGGRPAAPLRGLDPACAPEPRGPVPGAERKAQPASLRTPGQRPPAGARSTMSQSPTRVDGKAWMAHWADRSAGEPRAVLPEASTR